MLQLNFCFPIVIKSSMLFGILHGSVQICIDITYKLYGGQPAGKMETLSDTQYDN
jgi:hypothetical protein